MTNTLIIGSGTRFGARAAEQLKLNGHTTYGITGSTGDTVDHFLKVDWDKCIVTDFEKFLRSLPQLDYVIFNQNSPALTEDCVAYNNTHIFEIWKRVKRWNQSHYVNCGLPLQVLHTLNESHKISSTTKIAWMLSSSIVSHEGPVDYIGQKFQNYITMKRFAKNTSPCHIGFNPGHLTDDNRAARAEIFVNFLLNKLDFTDTGKSFKIVDQDVLEKL